MSRLVIAGGQLWTDRGLVEADIAVEDDHVVEVGPAVAGLGADTIDASGCLVLPGLVDLHAHFREPGYEEAEDITSGSAAAAAGGYTDVVAMPNTEPPVDTAEVVRWLQTAGERCGLVRVHPAACVTRSRSGTDLAELGDMYDAGVRIFTDDGDPVANSGLMRRALEYVTAFGGVIADHCQDPALTTRAQMHEGQVSGRLGLAGWPAAAEEIMVARDVILADATRGRVHIQHISTAVSVELVRTAKSRGVPVTAEVTTHHLLLTDEAAETFDPVYKVNPPIRSKEHVDALRAALADGTIDAVATDHAPHTPENKEEWTEALPGMLGLETALALVYGLVTAGELTLERLVDAMAVRPARIAGLPARGPIEVGTPGDVCVFDPAHLWTIEPKALHSKALNTPYAGWELTGRVRHTVCGGHVTLRDGEVCV